MLKTDAIPTFESLPQSFQTVLKNIPEAAKYYVALSGGLDSVALLLATHAYLRDKSHALPQDKDVTLKAVHIHHGLSPNADAWAEHCQVLCEALNVECVLARVAVNESGEGLEAAARQARYQVFESLMAEEVVLLQGHHLNDQAETVLMRLVKGLGPEALGGIPSSRPLASGCLYRPLLSLSRLEIERWATEQGLRWLEDESNHDRRFDRNFLRHDILPTLESRWPGVLMQVESSAQKISQSVASQSAWCAFHLSKLKRVNDFGDTYLELPGLAELPESLQRQLVRFWLDDAGIRQPSDRIFERIWTELIPARQDAMPEVRWSDHLLNRFQDGLYLRRASVSYTDYVYEFRVAELGECQTLECGEFVVSLVSGPKQMNLAGQFQLTLLDDVCVVRVQNRRGGESFQSEGSAGPQVLKRWFQARAVPPWWRNAPLVYFDDILVSAAGCALSMTESPIDVNGALATKAQTLAITVKPLA